MWFLECAVSACSCAGACLQVSPLQMTVEMACRRGLVLHLQEEQTELDEEEVVAPK